MKLNRNISRKIIATLSINLTLFASYASAGMYLGQKEFHVNELECLALNVYHETRAMSLADAHAVSDVVLNRVESTRYPNTICEVVHQGYKPGRKDCQFSWYCDGRSDEPQDENAWERSRKFARDMYFFEMYRGITEGATHYHATYVKPYWAPSLDRVAQIGAHIFYREK